MAGNNNMTLQNSSNITLKTFFLVATNSGQNIGVGAGNNLLQRQESKSALFSIDKGLTDYFMVFFTDDSGAFWQSQGNEANLDSGDTWTVTVTVSGNSPNISMKLEAISGGQAKSFGPWPIFKVGSVTAAQAA